MVLLAIQRAQHLQKVGLVVGVKPLFALFLPRFWPTSEYRRQDTTLAGRGIDFDFELDLVLRCFPQFTTQAKQQVGPPKRWLWQECIDAQLLCRRDGMKHMRLPTTSSTKST